MVDIPPLQELDVAAYYDPDTKVFYIHYGEELTASTSIKAYAWLMQNGIPLGVENIRAFIFDFTGVIRFKRDNTQTTQTQSRRANGAVDLSRIPAALVVRTFFQEQMVLLSMKANRVEDRTRICHSHDEALSFVEDFHRHLQKQDAENS